MSNPTAVRHCRLPARSLARTTAHFDLLSPTVASGTRAAVHKQRGLAWRFDAWLRTVLAPRSRSGWPSGTRLRLVPPWGAQTRHWSTHTSSRPFSALAGQRHQPLGFLETQLGDSRGKEVDISVQNDTIRVHAPRRWYWRGTCSVVARCRLRNWPNSGARSEARFHSQSV